MPLDHRHRFVTLAGALSLRDENTRAGNEPAFRHEEKRS